MAHKNEIKQLSDKDHVRVRPQMYVGDTSASEHSRWTLSGDVMSRQKVVYCPAVLKLFDEVISNSIDESFRLSHKRPGGAEKFTIWVNVDGDEITVQDTGRGIPLDPLPDNPKMTQAEAALTLLRAGSNFEKNETYASIGTHGLGATLVNILSSRFEACVVNKGRTLKLLATDGETQKMKIEDSIDQSGTRISFVPGWKHFTGVDSLDQNHADLIRKRVLDLAAALPMIQFKLNGRVVQTRDFDTYVKLASPERSFESVVAPHVRLAVISAEEPDQISFVNGIDTYEGGSHVDYFRNKVSDFVTERLNKKHKYGLKPQDVKNRLCFVLMTNSIFGPKFRSQTKEYLTNPSSEFAGRVFEGVDLEKLAKKVAENEDLMGPIVEFFRLKQQAKELEELKRKKRQTSKMKVAEHIPACTKDREKAILFITEGRSAIGQLASVRDPDIHGGFPLRGKPINVTGRRPLEMLENEEFKKLTSIIGLEIGEEPASLEYGTIALMADADHDGNSIMGLLINMFSLWPRLFDERRVKLCLSPVLKWEKGKQKRIYYTMGEYLEDRQAGNIPEGSALTYLKGLGSLTETEYSEMIKNPRMVTVNHGDDWRDSLHLVFGESADLRKTWLSE